MSRNDGLGKCDSCGGSFPYYLIHNGFNESAFAYCADCGRTALLDGWRMPKAIPIAVHGPVAAQHEIFLQACDCGGRFRGSASPRCPSCRHELSAVEATAWIERDAPGTEKGWRWQKAWQGLYAIVIGDRIVRDNWREP